MVSEKEKFKDITMVFRTIYKNSEDGGVAIHRNTLKNLLLKKGKVPSKARFMETLETMVNSGAVKVDREHVSLAKDVFQTGVLQKEKSKYFVVVLTNGGSKRIPVDKREASGYRPGEVLDVVVSKLENEKRGIILGRNKSLDKQKEIRIQLEKTQPKEEKVFKPIPQIEKDGAILGRVVKLSHNNLVFIPNKKGIEIRHIPILNEGDISKFQDKICVMKLVNERAPLVGGNIIEVKGDAGNPIHEYDAIAENYGAIMSWDSPELQKEISKIPTKVDVSKLDLVSEEEARISQRGKVVDLRHLPFSTIDPADCKDMDDAIYSTFDENGNYVCYTAVANATKYVSLDSEIGQRYVDGSFTVYAPNKAYGILPNELSNGICSLNPDEDRLAFVIKTVVDKGTGKTLSSEIFDSIIRSRKKYSYEEAQEIVDTIKPCLSKEELFERFKNGDQLSLEAEILMNYYAGEAIQDNFKQRGMLRFNAENEIEVKFDEDLKDVEDIKVRESLEYHKVIEAFMVAANEATAEYMSEHHIDGIYRVHEEPNDKKVAKAVEFFGLMGIEIGDRLSMQDVRDLLSISKGKPNEDMISQFLIKMQSRAFYRDKPFIKEQLKQMEELHTVLNSHSGLAAKEYAQTTAIIRRDVDYIVQYNILAHIHGTEPIPKNIISEIIDRANQRQLDVDQAERDFDDVSGVLYCEKHIGEVFKGSVSKFRYCMPEEGFDDEIVAIVKNREKGFSVEIPLSQLIGRRAKYCQLSKEHCAVYDSNGTVVLKLCAPVEFSVEKADRKAMNIVGKATKVLTSSNGKQKPAQRYYHSKDGSFVDTKQDRVKRYEKRKGRDHDKNRLKREEEKYQ